MKTEMSEKDMQIVRYTLSKHGKVGEDFILKQGDDFPSIKSLKDVDVKAIVSVGVGLTTAVNSFVLYQRSTTEDCDPEEKPNTYYVSLMVE